MKTLQRVAATGLLLCLTMPAQAFPRGGFGGGGYHFGGSPAGGMGGWQRGYSGYHPMFGANARPAWGGSTARPSWGSDDRNTGTINRTSINNGNWDGNRVNNINDRNVNVNNNFYNRDYNGWNNRWANGGYWNSRPWSAGWYDWRPNTWGWWGADAVGWGLAGLATGAVIGGLVNAAAANQSTVFTVPQTSFQLNYGSVEAVGDYGASFGYFVNGTELYGAANCQQGLLNGQVPANGDQAQLLNAVCQVAYGSGG